MYDVELNDIISEKNEKDRKLLALELRNLGGYKTLREFFDDLKEETEKNSSKALRLYRFAQWLSHESIFYAMTDMLLDLKGSLHAEYALKAVTKLPERPDDLCEAVPKILNCVRRFNDTGVIYQAVSLLRRMEEIDYAVRDCIGSQDKITINDSLRVHMGKRIENLAKYESEFHKNSDVRAEFTSKDEFMEFINLFIEFKNTL